MAFEQWYRNAVVYEVYPRSFADGNGDGVGDINGVRAHLDYLVDLGVDAIWLTPWYRSPMADGGYDVADYRAIADEFGTLDDAEALIAEAAERGIRTIIDIVPNHVSAEHPWFQEALAVPAGAPERDRFWFRPKTSPAMPTQWRSEFGGTTWSPVTGPDGVTEWYLHIFSVDQPDLNWGHEDVRAEFEDVLRFWLDRGVAGIRVDSAVLLAKDPALPEEPGPGQHGAHPFKDRAEVHDIYRAWRRVVDEYEPSRILVGELWLDDPDRVDTYVNADELHMAFNFDLLTCPWEEPALRDCIDRAMTRLRSTGAPSSWVLSNHDVTRPVTRYGRENTAFSFRGKTFGVPTDTARGMRAARAAALLVAALPGSLYIYQGDELGLPEVEELPNELRTDPMHLRSGGVDPGREGCRVPMPWSGEQPPFGFSPEGTATWLPQPAEWSALTVEKQLDEPESMLALYRHVLQLRRMLPALHTEDFGWLPVAEGVLAFRRRDLVCVVNLTEDVCDTAEHGILVASSAPQGTTLVQPGDAVWLVSAPQP